MGQDQIMDHWYDISFLFVLFLSFCLYLSIRSLIHVYFCFYNFFFFYNLLLTVIAGILGHLPTQTSLFQRMGTLFSEHMTKEGYDSFS